MAIYSIECNDSISTTTSIGSWVADATRPRRLKFFYIEVGCEATPADAAIDFEAGRITAAGTSTAVTPIPHDPADAATESDAGENHTVEPTYTANQTILAKSFHQRAGFRWQTDLKYAIVTPATASNGLGFRTPTISSGTPATTLIVKAEEQ